MAQDLQVAEGRAPRVLDGALLVLMVIALSVQGPNLFHYGGMDFTLGHALVGVVGCAAVVRRLLSGQRVALPSLPVNALMLVFVAVTLIDVPAHGFGSMILKYVFQYLVLVVCLNLMTLVGAERSERLMPLAAWVVLGIVLANAVAHASAFLEYYDHPWDGHPNYETIFSGGVNLEASWPAMLGVFFRNDRGGRAYLGLTLLYSVVVQSRAGLVLALAAIAYVVLVKGGRPRLRSVLAVAAVAVASVAVALLGPRAIAAQRDSATDVVTVEVETEAEVETIEVTGTPGRLGIWAGSVDAFAGAPVFGYGAGQAMDAVRAVTGFPYQEDNVHNYPLQVLLDFGVVGFAAFVVVVARFLWTHIRARLRNPFAAFVVMYLIGGLIQFRGGELLVGFAIAGVLAFGPRMRDRRYGEPEDEGSAELDG